jgi:altronate dehydratase small subunit
MAEEPLAQGAPLVLMHADDDVATALRDLAPGEVLPCGSGARRRQLEIRQAIPFGHKVAVTTLAAGQPVRKYGAVIGRATTAIAPGEHVHVHNLEGIRGRGDLAAHGGGADADAASG